MWPTWGPPGSCRPQVCPMLAPWALPLRNDFYSMEQETPNCVVTRCVYYVIRFMRQFIGRLNHFCDVIIASQITSLTIVYSMVYSDADRSKKISKLRVTGLCAGNSPGTDEFPAQMASYAENVSIWWRHHVWSHPHGTGRSANISSVPT